MKRKGFTLIELLAVIIILAVIALIATPIVLNVIENARRGAARDSAYGYIDGVKLFYADTILDGKDFILDGTFNVDAAGKLSGNNIELDGTKPSGGYLKYTNRKLKEGCLTISDYKVTIVNSEVTKVEKGSCSISEEKEEEVKIYGIKRNINSTSTSWERINDSVGLEANAQKGTQTVKNDFDNIYPWSDIITYNYDTSAETNPITAYIGDDDFEFDGSNGEVLTYIPEFYYKRYQDDTYEYIYISKDEVDNTYKKSEEFSVGRYTMSGSSEGVHSVSGQEPFTNKTIADYRVYARALGNGFGQMDYHYFILQMLYLVEYADYNSQSKLGVGYTRDNTTSITSGGCDDLGMKSGTLNNDGKHSIIYRGIEDIFGNIHQFVDGINIKDYQAYICYDQNKYESDKFDGDCYKPIGYINASTGGYISKLGYDSLNPMVALPTETLGSSSTYISDYYHQYTGNRTAHVGGWWVDASSAGLWYWYLQGASSGVSVGIGARLIKTS